MEKNNIKVIGNPNGTTMIFAHGFGSDQTAWAKVSEAFVSEYKVILFDNVGSGNSNPEAFSPNKYDNLYAYSEDLIAICDAYDVSDAIMIGHSVSGMISLLTAIKRPELFSKLIFVGASPRYLNDVDYIGGFEPEDLDVLFETMATNYFAWVSGFSAAVMANTDKPQLAEGFAATLRAIRPDIAQSVARVIFNSDYRSELSKLTKPSLIIQSKEDIAVPMEVAEYLNTHITNSQLNVVDAYGHFPHISAPDEIIKSIQNFI